MGKDTPTVTEAPINFRELIGDEKSRLTGLLASNTGTATELEKHVKTINAWVKANFSTSDIHEKALPVVADALAEHEKLYIGKNRDERAYENFPYNDYLFSNVIIDTIIEYGLVNPTGDKFLLNTKVLGWLQNSKVARRILYPRATYGESDTQWSTYNFLSYFQAGNRRIISTLNKKIEEKSKLYNETKQKAAIKDLLTKEYNEKTANEGKVNGIYRFLYCGHTSEDREVFEKAYTELLRLTKNDHTILLQLLKYSKENKEQPAQAGSRKSKKNKKTRENKEQPAQAGSRKSKKNKKTRTNKTNENDENDGKNDFFNIQTYNFHAGFDYVREKTGYHEGIYNQLQKYKGGRYSTEVTELEEGLLAYKKACKETQRIVGYQSVLMALGGAAIAADVAVMLWELLLNSNASKPSEETLLIASLSSLAVYSVFMGLFFLYAHRKELERAILHNKFEKHSGIVKPEDVPLKALIIKHGGTITEGMVCAVGTYAAIGFFADMLSVYTTDAQVGSFIPGQTSIDLLSGSSQANVGIGFIVAIAVVLSLAVGNAVRLGHLYLDGKNSDEEIKEKDRKLRENTTLPSKKGPVCFAWNERFKRDVSSSLPHLSPFRTSTLSV